MFNVTLHHLTPDAKKAGKDYPDLELADITADRLRGLIASLASLVQQDVGGATPQLRVSAPHGRFIVQIGEGRLRFNSWTTRVGGSNLSLDQICDAISGIEDPASSMAGVVLDTGDTPAGGRPRWMKILVLAIVILGSNAVTAWMLLRPPPNPFLPAYELLPSELAGGVLNDAAGDYRTGSEPGDLGLTVSPDGHVHWIKLGEKGKVIEESDLTVKAAKSKGHRALFTNNDALIDITDGNTLVYFGNTYHRRIL